MPFNPSAQTARNTKLVIQCEVCGKWRVLHSKHKIEKNQLAQIEQELDTVSYSCGSVFGEEESAMTDIFVRQNLTCNNTTEVTYYGAGHEPVCFYCGTTQELLDEESDEFYPTCSQCLILKKKKVARRSHTYKPKT